MEKNYKLRKYSETDGSEFYRVFDPDDGALLGDSIEPNQYKEPDFNIQNMLGTESPYISVDIKSRNLNVAVLINRETGIPAPRAFKQCSAPADAYGLAFVTIGYSKYLYSPQFDYVFPSAIDESALTSKTTFGKIATVFKEHPEDFIYLPTDCFRSKALVGKIFDGIKQGLREKARHCDADKFKGSSEELLSLIAERTKTAQTEIKKHDDPTFRQQIEAQQHEAKANTLANFNKGLNKIEDTFER